MAGLGKSLPNNVFSWLLSDFTGPFSRPKNPSKTCAPQGAFLAGAATSDVRAATGCSDCEGAWAAGTVVASSSRRPRVVVRRRGVVLVPHLYPLPRRSEVRGSNETWTEARLEHLDWSHVPCGDCRRDYCCRCLVVVFASSCPASARASSSSLRLVVAVSPSIHWYPKKVSTLVSTKAAQMYHTGIQKPAVISTGILASRTSPVWSSRSRVIRLRFCSHRYPPCALTSSAGRRAVVSCSPLPELHRYATSSAGAVVSSVLTILAAILNPPALTTSAGRRIVRPRRILPQHLLSELGRCSESGDNGQRRLL